MFEIYGTNSLYLSSQSMTAGLYEKTIDNYITFHSVDYYIFEMTNHLANILKRD